MTAGTRRSKSPLDALTAPTGAEELRVLLKSQPAPEQSLHQILAGADEWVVSLETAQLLSTLVNAVRPTSVLEFGAGRSSLVLAQALSRVGGGRLTSIEHQPQFARESWAGLSNYSTVDALLVPASLRLSLSLQGLLYEYRNIRRILSERGPFGLVLIDAPPGHLGRDSTLFRAMPWLGAGAIVVLDDAARPQEQTAIRRWARSATLEAIVTGVGSHGAAVFRVAGPTMPRFSLRNFVGTLHDRYRQRQYTARRRRS